MEFLVPIYNIRYLRIVHLDDGQKFKVKLHTDVDRK